MDDAAPMLQVDVISDMVCPWCFIGKRKLEQALARLDRGANVVLRWHPFELNPDLPSEGIARRAYLERKFGSAASADVRYERVRSVGSEVGIPFAFDRIERQPNTRDAHRLVWWAQEHGQAASPLVERLFTAYFVEGRAVQGVAALADVAAEAGLDRTAAEAFLASDAGVAEVHDAEQRAYAIGVSGVPFFIFDGKVAVSGAQSPEVLLQAIGQASEKATIG